jgi:uncharacterized protein YecT (DUF1311 family)
LTALSAILLVLSLWAGPTAPRNPEDCDALYYGEGRPKDLARALACYRADENWVMVAIMQLNGEGTPVDVAGARATFKRMLGSDGFMDADAEALDEILKAREAHPKDKGKRVDFCADVAAVTPSLGFCDRRAADHAAAEAAKRLAELRAGIEAGTRPAFDAAVAASQTFIAAEGERVYQKWIDGTIRAQASIAGESFARADFMRRIQALAGAAAPEAGKRSFADADRKLNVAYKQDVGDSSPDYKRASHKTQHEWVRYRDAMGKLAAVRWPARADVADLVRALVTEDRIVELTPGEGDIR